MATIAVENVKSFLSELETIFYRLVWDEECWNEYHKLCELYLGKNSEINKTEEPDFITIKWHVEDVQEIRPDLSNEQALEVLEHLQNNHDANTGINWEVIEYVANDLFSEPDNLEELRSLRDDQ